MMNAVKKRGRGFWITTAFLLLLCGYPVSFGPACWLASRCDDNELPAIFLPLGWLMEHSPPGINHMIQTYAHLGMPPNGAVSVPIGVKISRILSTDGPALPAPPLSPPVSPAQ